MMNYRIITNNKFYNLPIWGELNFKEINGNVVSDDFIRDNNLRELEKLGAVKIIPIGKIETPDSKKAYNTNSIRKSRKQLLEITSQDEQPQPDSEI